MRKKLFLFTFIFVFVMIALTACIPGDGSYSETRPAGFFWGIWHGWLAPISLIWGLFNENIGIYEVNNTGWWYDFGFYMAVISGFGGLSLARKKHVEGE